MRHGPCLLPRVEPKKQDSFLKVPTFWPLSVVRVEHFECTTAPCNVGSFFVFHNWHWEQFIMKGWGRKCWDAPKTERPLSIKMSGRPSQSKGESTTPKTMRKDSIPTSSTVITTFKLYLTQALFIHMKLWVVVLILWIFSKVIATLVRSSY